MSDLKFTLYIMLEKQRRWEMLVGIKLKATTCWLVKGNFLLLITWLGKPNYVIKPPPRQLGRAVTIDSKSSSSRICGREWYCYTSRFVTEFTKCKQLFQFNSYTREIAWDDPNVKINTARKENWQEYQLQTTLPFFISLSDVTSKFSITLPRPQKQTKKKKREEEEKIMLIFIFVSGRSY